MGRAQRAENALMTKMVKEGSRKGVTRFGKVADKLKRPPMWGAIAAGMAVAGPRSRRAAVRGSACYMAAALAHLPIKAVVRRKHPPRSSKVARVGPVTSFPSGHAASELAFSLGAAQEVPLLLVPLYAATAASEWSLLRARSHYLSDVVGGAALAVGVAAAAWKLWPTVKSDGGSPLRTVRILRTIQVLAVNLLNHRLGSARAGEAKYPYSSGTNAPVSDPGSLLVAALVLSIVISVILTILLNAR